MPRVSTSHRLRWWGQFLRQVATAFLKLVLVIAALFTLAAFVLWDVDFFAVRDRWEIFKIAMFGDWKGENAFQLPDDQMFVCEWAEGKTLGTCNLTAIDPETQKEMSDAN